MPFYSKLGKIPSKRHTVYRQPNGELYHEQLFGTIGFDGMSSLLYHLHRPTQVKEIKKAYSVSPEITRISLSEFFRICRAVVIPDIPFPIITTLSI